MVVQKKALMESLKMAMPGIETGNSTLSGADAFIFHSGRIYSYNDLISVAVPIEQAGLVEESIEGAVHADEFFKVISKFPSDEIEFEVAEKKWVLKNGKAKAELTLMEFEYQTRLEGVEPAEDWVDLPEDFADGLGTCLMQNNKTPMAGIAVKGATMYSTDGWQVNKYDFKDVDLPEFWLSDKSVAELLKVGKLTSVQLNGNWVHFKSVNETVFSVKTLQFNKFPLEAIEKVLAISDDKESGLHGKFPLEMFNAIDRAVPFSIETVEKPAIRLTLSVDGVLVESERATGNYVEKVDWVENLGEEFEPITVYVDPNMMSFIAKRSTEFYLVKQTLKSGKEAMRLLFVTPTSTHLISTIDVKK